MSRIAFLPLAAALACRAPATPPLPPRFESVPDAAFASAASGGVVLVAKDGQAVFRRAYGWADVEAGVAMRPDHVFAVGSITKQFTAVAILKLVDEGQIELEGDVRDYVPEFPTGGRRVTVEEVLTHTSGLPNFVDRPDFEELMEEDYSVDELLALSSGMPFLFEPGEGFAYSDTGYILLGAIIERAGGRSYADYLEEELFRPLGMLDTHYGDDALPRRATGYTLQDGELAAPLPISLSVPHAAGGIFSTVDDLLRWENALRAGHVLPPELLEQAWAPRTLPDGTRSGYGFGWKLCTLEGRPTREHGGFLYGYQSTAMSLPEDGWCVIVLVNNDADAPDAGALARRLGRLLLTGAPEPAYHDLTADEEARLTGTYRTARGTLFEIVSADGQLLQAFEGDPPIRLLALSPTELTYAESEGGFVLSFELGPDGHATGLAASLRCEPSYRASRSR